jgi:hypothetical protein
MRWRRNVQDGALQEVGLMAGAQDEEKLGASRRLRRELDYQNQVRDHAADESDRPDELLQQRLISVNSFRRGFEWPVLAGVHRALS